MKFPRFPVLRSFRFAPLAVTALFFLYNFTGIFLSNVFAPSTGQVVAMTADNLPSDIPTSGDHDLDLIIYRAGERNGVDPRLIHAVIWQESKYDLRARSSAGAQGLMQLIPATASRFNCNDIQNASKNVEAGTKYLRWLLERFNGDVSLALAAYNAGEGSVDKYNGIPPYNETQNYVRIIVGRYGKTIHPLLDGDQARVDFALTGQVAQLSN